MASTIQQSEMITKLGRKCKYCRYYVRGWCYWHGRHAMSNDEECEDGFATKE